MKLKYYAAIMTGALAMVLTALLLWTGTQLLLEDVIAFALVAYYVGLVGAYTVIGQMEKRRLRKHAVQIVTLVQVEMDRRKEDVS